MNINKSEVKIFTAHELGCRLDDLLESNSKDMYRLEGGVVALRQASAAMDTLMAVVDKEIDEEKFDLVQAKEIKRYIQRAAQAITNLILNTDNNRIAYSGRIQALGLAVGVAKKYQDDESKKISMLQTALEEKRAVKDGDSHEMLDAEGNRPVAIRPGASLKEQRLAEERVNDAAGESLVETSIEIPPEPVKRRGRPRKNP